MNSFLILVAIVTAETQTLGPDDHTRQITVGDLNRRNLVHVPATYDPAKPTPVVLAFHGGGANADNMVVFSGLNKTADDAGFIAVYPRGT